MSKEDRKEKVKDILHFLLTHNKNYTQKQYHFLLELQELLQTELSKAERDTL